MADTHAVQQEIGKLKKEKNTLILAHYYQSLEVQAVADIVGDSFELARKAQAAKEDAILLCGVRFMAESAKILNPNKRVYLAAATAGCPMADMVTSEDVRQLRQQYPQAAVVCYVNSSAAVKAECDICCTSSSAVRIVENLPQKQVIFVPDKNLGAYVAAQVPEKEIILFHGYCPAHNGVTEADAKRAKAAHPGAALLVHPECPAEVLAYADYVGSTAGILEYARKSDRREFIIGTEQEIVEMLRQELPDKGVYPIRDGFVCPDMKQTTLEDILACLKGNGHEILLPEAEMERARQSLERMVQA